MSTKKRESRLGILLTAVVCVGFLYYWFRPKPAAWVHQSAGEVVTRAMAEPAPADEAGRWLLDLDLMETAILQARLGMAPEGMETAKGITDPVIQARTIRQLAQAHLNNDEKRMGDALTMCDAIADPALRQEMREEVLLQIAMVGFADVALPQADTPLLKAKLAHRLAQTDGPDTARELLATVKAEAASVPESDAAALRTEIAWTHTGLALVDGPEQAFAPIQALPADEQAPLWTDLFRVCFGRPDSAADSALVLQQIQDPVLRRTLELEAVQSNQATRPAEDILGELEKERNAAAPGRPKIAASLALADARLRALGADAATPILKETIAMANALTDPVARCRALADLAGILPDALLMAESAVALDAATLAARSVVAPDHRLPLLILLTHQAFNSGEMQRATALADEATALAATVPGDPAGRTELADFLGRLGRWPEATAVLAGIPDTAARTAALDATALVIAEDCIGYDPGQPSPRGPVLDRIRLQARDDEAGAAAFAAEQPAGLERARAWLAVAKGLLLPPVPVFEPMDPTGPEDDLPEIPEEK